MAAGDNHPATGVQFKERMVGRLTFGAKTWREGYDSFAAIPFVLDGRIDIANLSEFIADPTHTGGLEGSIYSPRVGGRFPATKGLFQLFRPTDDPLLTLMVYEMTYLNAGKTYRFAGKKTVRIGPPWRLWPETTTLYVDLHEGKGKKPKIVARGIIRLSVWQGIRLLTTLRGQNGGFFANRATAFRFLAFFSRELIRTYVLRRPVDNYEV